MSADLAIGIDLGTSGVAVVALGRNGEVVARADRPIALYTPRPGWTQQDPPDWLAAAEEGLQAVATEVGSDRVAAIGLTGQMHGMVALDAAERVVYPAILWNDGRTAAQVEQIERLVGTAAVVQRTGNRPVTGFQLPKVLWLRDNEPDLFARSRHVLFPKDYLGLHLTGRRYAEPADASGSGCFELATGDWDGQTLAALDLEPGLWPGLVRSTEVVGELRSTVAARVGLAPGVPVVAGAGDNAAAATALGLSADAPALTGIVSLGTSGVVQVPTQAPTPDPQGRVHLFAHALGGYLLMGVTLAAGGSLRWYRDTFAPTRSYADLMALAAMSEPGANGVTFVPYLAGERTPHMRADLRGSFHGLSLATTEADVVRAVIEGVAFSLKDALSVMQPMMRPEIESDAGGGQGAGSHSPSRFLATRFLATGGGASSDLWLATIATLFDATLARPLGAGDEAYEVGAAEGAAVLAWRGVDVMVETAPLRAAEFEPAPEIARRLREAYERYRGLSGAD
ncbi:MAG TPA: xylulokinase [Trueperaceae bacterium]|nr:xylulokinase [Trueperaceae bacterium]